MGLGLAHSTSTSAALVELTEERAGVGSAVLQAVNKVGGPFGTAILGSALSSVYLPKLILTGLPAPAAAAVKPERLRGSCGRPASRVACLAALGSQRVHVGDGRRVVVSAGIAIVGLALTLLFLPRSNALQENQRVQSDSDRSLPASAELRTAGLRERKKARTRATIRAHALRLFLTQGYDATTVQQIIEEVEVSESTFFRYFRRKQMWSSPTSSTR